MFCGSCGKQNDDSAKFCVHCGASADGSAPSRPAGDSLSEPVAITLTGPVTLSVGSYARCAAARPCSDYLIPNILELLLCCCFPTTIVGLCFSIASRCAKSRGDWDKALERAAVAKTLFWVTPFFVILLFLAAGSFNATISNSCGNGENVSEKTCSGTLNMKNLFEKRGVRDALSELSDAFNAASREFQRVADELADDDGKGDHEANDDAPSTKDSDDARKDELLDELEKLKAYLERRRLVGLDPFPDDAQSADSDVVPMVPDEDSMIPDVDADEPLEDAVPVPVPDADEPREDAVPVPVPNGDEPLEDAVPVPVPDVDEHIEDTVPVPDPDRMV